MSRFSLTHLSDGALLRDLAALVATDRATTASLLAHLAEVDRRRLYAKQGCDSLYEYCLRELKLSEDAAAQRIQAARAARRCPAILAMLADGRLHLSAVRLLAPRLTRANAPELLAAATHRTRREVEALLAERFPRPDLPTLVQPLAPTPRATGSPAQAPGPAGIAVVFEDLPGNAMPTSELPKTGSPEPAPGHVEPGNTLAASELANGHLSAPVASFLTHPCVAILAPGRIGLQFTVSQATHDKLRHAQELLSHAVPSGDLAEVLDRALDALIGKLERRKFGATDRPRAAKASPSGNPRSIPNEVHRAVKKRDGRQCTYVGSGGVRCESRRRLEFEHIVPVAHGGQPTLANLRLLCRAHNQLQADHVLGTEYMQARRNASRTQNTRVDRGTTMP